MKSKFLLGLLAGLCLSFACLGQSAPPQFINQSVLGPIAPGAGVLTQGFIVQAAPGIPSSTAAQLTDRLLIRGVGPNLKKSGISDPAVQPTITVFDSSGRVVARNQGWGSDPAIAIVSSQVGAFPLDPGSADSALVKDLPPGAYTVQVTDPLSPGQRALAEVYDVTRNTGLIRLGNMSARSINQVTIGFVTDGRGAKPVLVRAIGPSLAQFGLTSVVADPRLTVFDNHGIVIAQNDNWDPSLGSVFAQTGAFPLPTGSKDAALTLTLSANGPTSITALGDRLGVGPFADQVLLVEIYDISTN